MGVPGALKRLISNSLEKREFADIADINSPNLPWAIPRAHGQSGRHMSMEHMEHMDLDVHSPEFLASLSLSFQHLPVQKRCSKKIRPTERPTEPGRSDRSHGSSQACGWSLVLLMNLFIAFQMDGFWRLSLPWFALEPLGSLTVKCGSVSLFILIEFFYACTSLVDPGSPGKKDVVSDKSDRWCNHCMAPKPDRCHHCSTCRRCVLRMDHHCIFTNSCIGQRNQRYFLVFVFLTMCGSGLSALAAAPQIPAAIALSFGERTMAMAMRQVHLIGLCLSAATASVLLWNLLLGQMHLLIRNETTIESLKNWADRCHSSFDRGVRENIAEVFGSNFAGCIPNSVLDIFDGLDQFLADDS